MMKKANGGSSRNETIFSVLGTIVVLMLVAALAFWLNTLLSVQTSRTSQLQQPKFEDRIAFIRESTVWLGRSETPGQIEVASLNQVKMPTLGEVDQVSFSPDGQWLLFHHNHNIWVTNISTAQIYQLSEQGQVYQGGWIVDAHSGIWSPDSKFIAYIVETSGDGENNAPIPQVKTGLWISHVDRSEHRYITDDIIGVYSFIPTGRGIVYKRSSTGDSALIDIDTLQITVLNTSFFSGQYTFSKDGARMAHIDKIGSNYIIAIADQDGKNSQVVVESPLVVQFPTFSPDGRYLSFVKQVTSDPTRQELWIADLITKTTRLISADALDSNWSSNGKTLIFWRRTSNDFNSGDLFSFALESGVETQLTITNDIFPRFAISR